MAGHRHVGGIAPDVAAATEEGTGIYLRHTVTRKVEDTVNVYGRPTSAIEMRLGDEMVTTDWGGQYPRYTVHTLLTGWLICDVETGAMFFDRTLNKGLVQRALDGDAPDFVGRSITSEE